MLTKLATFRGVSPEGEPLVQLFRQGDSIQKVAGRMAPEVQDWLSTYKSDKKKIALLINAMGVSEYYGSNCLPAGTPISMSNGEQLPVEVVKVGDEVISHAGVSRAVKEVFRGKAHGLVGVRPQGHARHLWTTRGHPYWAVTAEEALRLKRSIVYKRYRKDADKPLREALDEYCRALSPSWIEASSLKKGDVVFMKIEDAEEVDIDLTKEGMAFLLGIYVAKGCPTFRTRATKKGNKRYPCHTVLTLGGNEGHIAEKVRDIAASWGLSAGVTYQYQDRNAIRVELSSPNLTRILMKHGGRYSTHKRLSASVMRMPRAWQFEFLEAYLLGDGCQRGTAAKDPGAIRASTASIDLAIDLRMLSARLGMVASIVPCKQHETSLGAGNDIYEVSIPASQSVGEKDQHIESLIHPDGYLVCPVKTVELDEQWEGDVYNFEVDVDNSYNADGVALHNSNGDYWPLEALAHDCRTHSYKHSFDDFSKKIIPPYGYWTFLEAKGYVHHQNKNPERAFGDVHLPIFNKKMKRVELVATIDRERAAKYEAQHVLDRIDANEYPDVSMGARVPWDRCIICGNKSRTRKDYCECVKKLRLNTVLPDGRKVAVANDYPRFFDISFVFIGADRTANMMAKLGSAQGEDYVPESVRDADEIYQFDENMLVKAAADRSSGEELVHMLAEKKLPRPYWKLRPRGDKLDGGSGPGDGVLPTNFSDATDTTEDFGKYAGPEKVTKTFTVTGGKDVVDSIEKMLAAAEALGSWGASRTLSMGVDGDGAARLKVEGAREVDGKHFDKLLDADEVKTQSVLLKEAAGVINRKLEPPPSPNRKEYPFVGTIHFRGLTIHVENKAGDYREGKDKKGKKWRTLMRFPYGEIVGAKGADKEALDVYVGPRTNAKDVFIVHQNFVGDHPKAGSYDEDKVMLGFGSLEEAKTAYLAHYNRKDFLRSVTSMRFADFEKMVRAGHLQGEKVAGLDKLAEHLSLEELFNGASEAQRRQRTWRDKVSNAETQHVGSGLGESFATMQKTASLPGLMVSQDFFGKQKQKADLRLLREEVADQEALRMVEEAGLKVAEDSAWWRLLKEAALKISAQNKEADIDKEIDPSAAVGRVSPLLQENEHDLPDSLLDALGGQDLAGVLSSTAAAGLGLHPREFQRILLVCIQRPDAADSLDDANTVFGPTSAAEAPCAELGLEAVLPKLLEQLLPHLEDRSYLGPVLKRRILRISAVPARASRKTEKQSPLLTKISAAYNWYRQEMLKVAAQADHVLAQQPKLAAAVYGLSDVALFSKHADALSLGAAAASAPIAMLYSSSLRNDERSGEPLGLISQLIAHNPGMSAMAAAALVRELMKNPGVHDAVGRGAATAGRMAKQILTGGA